MDSNWILCGLAMNLTRFKIISYGKNQSRRRVQFPYDSPWNICLVDRSTEVTQTIRLYAWRHMAPGGATGQLTTTTTDSLCGWVVDLAVRMYSNLKF